MRGSACATTHAWHGCMCSEFGEGWAHLQQLDRRWRLRRRRLLQRALDERGEDALAAAAEGRRRLVHAGDCADAALGGIEQQRLDPRALSAAVVDGSLAAVAVHDLRPGTRR